MNWFGRKKEVKKEVYYCKCGVVLDEKPTEEYPLSVKCDKCIIRAGWFATMRLLSKKEKKKMKGILKEILDERRSKD